MKITIIYNQVTSLDHGNPEDILADQDSIKTAYTIKDNLQTLGHSVNLFELNEHNAADLMTAKPDVFFNQAFGIGNQPKSEAAVTQLLDQTGIPYTGSQAIAINFSNDKIGTKNILTSSSLPTPSYQVFITGQEVINPDLRYPLIIKLTQEHCSLGLGESSIVHTPQQLIAKVSSEINSYQQQIIAEEYIDGRELNVALLGNGPSLRALPISEITFGDYFHNHPKIVDFSAKWREDSEQYKATVGVCPAGLPAEITTQVQDLAKQTFRLTDCHDYARVDFRLALKNQPYILELNANPGIGPDDGFVRSARAAGFSYGQLLEEIIRHAQERYQHPHK